MDNIILLLIDVLISIFLPILGGMNCFFIPFCANNMFLSFVIITTIPVVLSNIVQEKAGIEVNGYHFMLSVVLFLFGVIFHKIIVFIF